MGTILSGLRRRLHRPARRPVRPRALPQHLWRDVGLPGPDRDDGAIVLHLPHLHRR